MDRMFDEMLGVVGGGLWRRNEGAIGWTLSIDVIAADGNLLIRAELPGVKQEDVEVTLRDNVLTVSGERRTEREEKGGGYHVRECRRGSFERSITLPEGADESKIRALYEDGVLEITVEGAGELGEIKRIEVEGFGG